jgi:regulation of enolase protein 1 (concanavalin A-like superfamily)
MPSKLKLGLLLCASVAAGVAGAFPLWLESPSRSNPFDQKSPLYRPATAVPTAVTSPLATLTPTMTVTPGGATFTATATATLTPGAGSCLDDAFSGASLNPKWLSQFLGYGVTSTYTAATVGGGVLTIAMNQNNSGNMDGSDRLHFLAQTISGDFTATLQVHSVPAGDAWAKGGLMARASLDPKSADVMVQVTRSNGYDMQARTGTAFASTDFGTGGAFTNPGTGYLRLARAGNTFTGYYSADGSAWTALTSTTIAMGSTVYLGIATTPNNWSAGTATYSHFSATTAGTCGVPTPTASPTAMPNRSALYRVNAGDVQYVDSGGNTWSADQAYAPGGWGNIATTATGGMGAGTTVGGTKDPALFAKAANGATAHYKFDAIPSGDFKVTLWFIENYWTMPGKRVFDVAVNGSTVAAGVDPYVRAGNGVADPLTMTVHLAAPGSIDIVVTATADQNSLAAIEIANAPTCLNDAFAGAALDPKWLSGTLGYGVTATYTAATVGGGTLNIAMNQNNSGNMDGSDRMHFLSQRVTGDFEATLKIHSVPTNDAWSKGGLMARAGLDPKSADVMIQATRSNGYDFQSRSGTAINSVDHGTAGAYTNPGTGYLKLKRVGDDFSGYYSPDGVAWTQVASTVSLPAMGSQVYLGVATTTNNWSAGTASYSDFTIDSGGVCSAPTPVPTPTPLPASAALYRVNAGDLLYTDVSGNAWAADKPYTAGTWGNLSTTATGGMGSGTTVGGTADPALFYKAANGATAHYRFDNVAAGTHPVTLWFIENFWTQPGKRVFDVAINGATVATGLDPFVRAGNGVADPYTTNVVLAAPGAIDIIVTATADQNSMAAIEVK